MNVAIMEFWDDPDTVSDYIHSLVCDEFRIRTYGRYKGNFVVETTEEFYILLRLKYGYTSIWITETQPPEEL